MVPAGTDRPDPAASDFSLTITIPTYNRNAFLLDTVKVLLPQLSPQVGIVIHDNHSPIPAEQTLAPVLAQHENGQWVTIVYNRANVGADANVLRGLEAAEGDWVWILCDDDAPDPNAVAIIRDTVARHPSVSFINFYSPADVHPVRTETKIAAGLDEFLAMMDRFGSFMFAPACVFKTKQVQSRLRLGYFSVNTYATHFAMLLDMLQEGNSACQSHEIIVRFRDDHPAGSWSWLEYGLGVPLLTELVRDPKLRRRLLRAIVQDIPLRTLYRPALLIARDQQPASYGRFMFVQVMRRTFYRALFPLRSAMLGFAMSQSLRFPRFTYATILLLWKTFGGEAKWAEHRLTNRFAR